MRATAEDRKRRETLRYMGYRGQELSPETERVLDSVLAEASRVSCPRAVSGRYPLIRTKEGIVLEGTTLLLTGRDIESHLEGAAYAILFAVTLGAASERALLTWEKKDLSRAIMLDAALSAEIEAAVDEYERGLVCEAQKDGFYTNWRFSPVYGDLPLTLQRTVGQVLNFPRTIGVTVTEHSLMIPRKTVTAVIGCFEEKAAVTGKVRSCAECVLKGDCEFTRWGETCRRKQPEEDTTTYA